MKVLFDQGTPKPLRSARVGHTVETAYERGWSMFTNGDLLIAAETAAFDVLITTDKNLGDQLDLSGRSLAVIVLPTTRWPEIREHTTDVLGAVNAVRPGEYRELVWDNR